VGQQESGSVGRKGTVGREEGQWEGKGFSRKWLSKKVVIVKRGTARKGSSKNWVQY